MRLRHKISNARYANAFNVHADFTKSANRIITQRGGIKL